MSREIDPRAALVSGPYKAPRCKVGRDLACAIRGEVVVRGLSDGPLPWPFATVRGQRSLVVCGGLRDALGIESSAAIQRLWGVSEATVLRWRKALEIAGRTEGLSRLRRAIAADCFGPDGPRKGGLASKGVPKTRHPAG